MDTGVSDFKDERNARKCLMKQINIIIENLFKPFGEEQKMRFIKLREILLSWIVELARKQDAYEDELFMNRCKNNKDYVE